MSSIFENLYMGDLDDAYNSSDLRAKKYITHILTIDCKPLILEAKAGFEYKYIHALDKEDFDLLSHFDDCVEFIDDGRKAGGVFVHCYAGQSRSATIVIAYLMAKQDMTVAEASQFVKKMRTSIGPNPGFMKQLELFEAMGNHIDPYHAQYRQYRLGLFATQMLKSNLQEDNLATCLSADPSLSNSSEAVYKCRKCRRSLFRESGIITHSIGFSHSSFSKASKVKKTARPQVQNPELPCSDSIFIEPVVWMQNTILQQNGKLNCPNCQAKIGSFRWAGDTCSCGQWVTPAFHMQKSKLDYCDTSTLLVRKPIAFPPVTPVTSISSDIGDDGNKASTVHELNVSTPVTDAV